jgi:hypothetical protein
MQKLSRQLHQGCQTCGLRNDKVFSNCSRAVKPGNNKVGYKEQILGKLPGLVVNIKDSQSEPWSLDMSSVPGFAEKLDG